MPMAPTLFGRRRQRHQQLLWRGVVVNAFPYIFGENAIQEFQVAVSPYRADFGGAATGFVNRDAFRRQ